MPSERKELWVWNAVPGQAAPVLCSRFRWAPSVGGLSVGSFEASTDARDPVGSSHLRSVLTGRR